MTRKRRRDARDLSNGRGNGHLPSSELAIATTNQNGHAPQGTDIVVCVHNALADVRLCLDSIVVCGDEYPLHLILVDDGSGPECAAFLREFAADHPGVELTRHDESRGYTRAANAGLRRTTADRVVLLNSDTIVTPGWLAGLRECLDSAPEIGIVSPLSNAASYQSIPAIRSPSGDWSLNPIPASWSVDQIAALVREVSPRRFPRLPFLNGFCLMISRRVIETIGYFDEEAFPAGFGEENDYCLRARAAGFALAVADHVYVFHAKSRSFGNARRAALSAHGREALERKHGPDRVRDDIAAINANTALTVLRDTVDDVMRFNSPPPERPARDGLSVLFLLPVSGGGGGAHSIVQEAMGMRPLGVRSHVAVKSAQAALHAANYPSAWGRHLFLPFDTKEHLVRIAGEFDVVVATIFTSMHLLQAAVAAHPGILPAYYVQDYEPWFCREGTRAREAALATYTAIPDMLLFAKTNWLCALVQELHDVPVRKVQPGLDPDVYFPGDRPHGDTAPVRVAAMIRPSTPRRAAYLTMDVLEALDQRFRHDVQVHIFGSTDDTVDDYGLTPDFPVVNHGKLKLEQVADLLRAADVFLDLSEYQAFGRTGLEAMACGCVTVLPVLGGTDEYALDRENALVVDTADFAACVAATAELIEDAALRRRLQRAGYATAERYSIFQAALSEVTVFRDGLRETQPVLGQERCRGGGRVVRVRCRESVAPGSFRGGREWVRGILTVSPADRREGSGSSAAVIAESATSGVDERLVASGSGTSMRINGTKNASNMRIAPATFRGRGSVTIKTNPLTSASALTNPGFVLSVRVSIDGSLSGMRLTSAECLDPAHSSPRPSQWG